MCVSMIHVKIVWLCSKSCFRNVGYCFYVYVSMTDVQRCLVIQFSTILQFTVTMQSLASRCEPE